MALGTSPEKIDIIIRTVLGKLCPTIDTSTLKLPKKSCANYMRMAEMPTVSNVHKATKLTELPQGHMNTDGTTLNLKRLVGSSVSGLVLGVQEVLVKNQVRVRSMLLGRQTKITFSTGGIQKPYVDLLQEVEVMIQREEDQRKRPSTTTPPIQPKRNKQSAVDYLTKPTELVGKDIVHRFVNDDEEEQLWAGKITSYNHATEKHTLTYTGDTEQYTYNLTSDITNGDLWNILYIPIIYYCQPLLNANSIFSGGQGRSMAILTMDVTSITMVL